MMSHLYSCTNYIDMREWMLQEVVLRDLLSSMVNSNGRRSLNLGQIAEAQRPTQSTFDCWKGATQDQTNTSKHSKMPLMTMI